MGDANPQGTPLDRWKERVDERAHKTAATLERVGAVVEHTATTLERVAGVVDSLTTQNLTREATDRERRRMLALAGRLARWAIGTALAALGTYAAIAGVI